MMESINTRSPVPDPQPAPNKACTSCRAAKVRCLPLPSDSTSSSKSCLRCTRTNRTCIWAPPARRRPRKRTDTRVAELEREVQALQALFSKSLNPEEHESPPGPQKPATIQEEDEERTPSTIVSQGPWSAVSTLSAAVACQQSPFNTLQAQPQPWIQASLSPETDVISQGIISESEASALIESYNTSLLFTYPAVQLPPGTTPESLRRSHPTLFLAILAAAACKTNPHLYSQLNTAVLTTYTYRAVLLCEKNLELVQAMIITCVWYHPPAKFAKLKVYEYIHMASNMAVDIGMGTSPDNGQARWGVEVDVEGEQGSVARENDLQKRRTILVCYMITTSAALGMRRINMLRFNSWMNDCVETISKNPTDLDKHLLAWVELMKISDEIGVAFSFEDHPSSYATLDEPRVQITLAGFERTLEKWKKTYEEINNHDAALMLQYHHTQILLHEVALYEDHPLAKFVPPWTLQKVLAMNIEPSAKGPHVTAISVLISSVHSLLSIILASDIEVLRTFPIVNIVRMVYSLVVLIAIYISSKSPNSKIGTVVDRESLRLGYYLDAIIEKLIEAVGPLEFRSPATFLSMILRWKNWYKSQEEEEVFRTPTKFPPVDFYWAPPLPFEHVANSGVSSRASNSPRATSGTSKFDYTDQQMNNFAMEPTYGNVDLDATMDLGMNYAGHNQLDGSYANGEVIDDFAYDFFGPNVNGWISGSDMPAVDDSADYSWNARTANNGPV